MTKHNVGKKKIRYSCDLSSWTCQGTNVITTICSVLRYENNYYDRFLGKKGKGVIDSY